ncbi:type II secretion system F family protein [Allosphingosinicella indica]|uniref:Tight adherence protein B n=1 Tax=Allosphingosinicella indica TaxID=941907 RepID=A0A1X7FYY0_9SPHN|nr:type II secretion system F family protein [Allosphingosinicella indica]SMF61305.1 tight adherence protein B [Allosphingosinicella indica]
MLPMLMIMAGMGGALALLYFAMAGPSTAKAQARRLEGLRERHSRSAEVAAQAQLRKITAARDNRIENLAQRFIPNPALLRQRLERTGRTWTLGQYAMASAGLAIVVAFLLSVRGAPGLFSIMIGLLVGIGLPHLVVGFLVKRRVNQFTTRFPDAIELMVRGLRSGLPISETIQIVASEIPGPVSVEFREVSDKMKIGRTMEAALQDVADRLGTPEFQFFVITLAIQRETGGNLAETLSNLADVLRKRAQMKLKIRAMSSESKASAYIIGALPFIVFTMIWIINRKYMAEFFSDPRLMVIGAGGLLWMCIGAFIMAKMIRFEI